MNVMITRNKHIPHHTNRDMLLKQPNQGIPKRRIITIIKEEPIGKPTYSRFDLFRYNIWNKPEIHIEEGNKDVRFVVG